MANGYRGTPPRVLETNTATDGATTAIVARPFPAVMYQNTRLFIAFPRVNSGRVNPGASGSLWAVVNPACPTSPPNVSPSGLWPTSSGRSRNSFGTADANARPVRPANRGHDPQPRCVSHQSNHQLNWFPNQIRSEHRQRYCSRFPLPEPVVQCTKNGDRATYFRSKPHCRRGD